MTSKKYPILNILFHEGVRGLFHYVSDMYDFVPDDGYMSKCHFCLDLRRHLVLNGEMKSKELQPKAFYDHV